MGIAAILGGEEALAGVSRAAWKFVGNILETKLGNAATATGNAVRAAQRVTQAAAEGTAPRAADAVITALSADDKAAAAKAAKLSSHAAISDHMDDVAAKAAQVVRDAKLDPNAAVSAAQKEQLVKEITGSTHFEAAANKAVRGNTMTKASNWVSTRSMFATGGIAAAATYVAMMPVKLVAKIFGKGDSVSMWKSAAFVGAAAGGLAFAATKLLTAPLRIADSIRARNNVKNRTALMHVAKVAVDNAVRGTERSVAPLATEATMVQAAPATVGSQAAQPKVEVAVAQATAPKQKIDPVVARTATVADPTSPTGFISPEVAETKKAAQTSDSLSDAKKPSVMAVMDYVADPKFAGAASALKDRIFNGETVASADGGQKTPGMGPKAGEATR